MDTPPEARSPCFSDDEIDDVIAWLLQRGYLDEQRFVASRVHVRSERFGVSRIEQELSRHGLDLPADAAEALRTTELERAKAVWQRRFGSPPVDIRDAARQARFLAGRGFSGDVIRRVVPRWLADRSTDLEPG
ncbi:MAG: regulatory protein RecX [Ideonella sp.]